MDELHLKNGDTLSIEIKEGGLKLDPVDKEFEEWAEAYRSANMDYKDVLKKLASAKLEKKELVPKESKSFELPTMFDTNLESGNYTIKAYLIGYEDEVFAEETFTVN